MDRLLSPSPASLTHKGRATRDRIVGVAATLMFSQGVASTSTDQVQRISGVSSSQLYHYFQSKRDLVQAVIARQMETVLQAQHPHLDNLDSVASLYAYRDHLVRLQAQGDYYYGCPLGLLTSELASPGSPARDALIVAFERWESPIRNGIQRMIDSETLRSDADSGVLARAFMTAIQGGLMLSRAHQNTAHLTAALTTVIDQIASYQRAPVSHTGA